MTQIKYNIWAGSYLTFGIICSGIGIIYAFFVGRDLKSLTPKLPGYKSSQIFFIIASLLRGFLWITFAALMLAEKKFDIEKHWSPILIGIPGYILTISYSLLFYLWSSICVNLIANDSTTGLKETFKNILTITLTIIGTLACALIVITFAFLGQDGEKQSSFRIFEGSLALIRDFATGSILLVFTIRIITMLQRPFCSAISNESAYCWMLLCLVAALYVRCASITLYLFKVYYKDQKGVAGNYVNTFITAILSELFPCFMILFTRKRSGLLSVYDLIN